MYDQRCCTRGAHPRLLLVEDDLQVTFALREFFCEQGFSVDCVSGLTEGQRLLDRFEYAVLLTDLHLSGQKRAEGLQILSKAREQQPAIQAIVMTAFPTAEIENDTRRLGADLLTKPFGLPALHQVIGKRVLV